jgi:hypothetical protein
MMLVHVYYSNTLRSKYGYQYLLEGVFVPTQDRLLTKKFTSTEDHHGTCLVYDFACIYIRTYR